MSPFARDIELKAADVASEVAADKGVIRSPESAALPKPAPAKPSGAKNTSK